MRPLAIIQRLFAVLAALAVAFFLIYLFENWRGQRAWKRFVREMESQHEQLNWQAFVPEPVPDDQNFLSAPFLDAIAYKGKVNPDVWQRLQSVSLSGYNFDAGTWRAGTPIDLQACRVFLEGNAAGADDPRSPEAAQTILREFAPLESEFTELRLASLRPHSQLRGDPDPAGGRVPNHVGLRALSYLLSLRVSAELARHQTNEAFADALVIHQLGAALRKEPNLISVMIGCAILGNMGLQTFWEGVSNGQWSDDQLQTFQRSFETCDLLRSLDTALRGGERAGVNYVVQSSGRQGLHKLFGSGGSSGGFKSFVENLYYRAWPRGWLLQNQIFHNRLLHDTALSNYDVAQHRVFPDKCQANNQTLNTHLQTWSPFAHLAAIGIPNFLRATETITRTQASIDQAQIVCALERFRRSRASYPSELAALVPDFISKLPLDLLTGRPMEYRRIDPERYLLYSIGWDQTDDGGRPEGTLPPPPHATNSAAARSGDWVWPNALPQP